METAAIDAEWGKTFKKIVEEVIPRTKTTKNYDDRSCVTGVTETDDEKLMKLKIEEKKKKLVEQRKMRMMHMQPLFASQPRCFEMLCKDWDNNYVDSGGKSYAFRSVTTASFKNKEDNLKYVINHYGDNLIELELYSYHFSRIMLLIKSNCLNLTSLSLRFKQVESKDFDNVFCNMYHLEKLIIEWRCENSTLPMTLIKSLEQVSGTLKLCTILCQPEKYNLSERPVAASVSSVLSPETKALMTVISNMKNLEAAMFKLDYGFTDEFFINLINNSKNLRSLCVRGSNITDKGLLALNNLHKLESFNLGLIRTNIENKFITDQSIRSLFNKEISRLEIANCPQVTNSSIIELVKNLPNLQTLHIENTKANIEIVEGIANLTQDRKLHLSVFVSFKINDDKSYSLKINPSLLFFSSFKC